MPPSLPGLPVRTCVGTLLHWEPIWQYPVKITNIQVDITFIISKLFNGVLFHMPKELNGLSDQVLSHWFPKGKSFHPDASSEGGMGMTGPNQMKMWSNPGPRSPPSWPNHSLDRGVVVAQLQPPVCNWGLELPNVDPHRQPGWGASTAQIGAALGLMGRPSDMGGPLGRMCEPIEKTSWFPIHVCEWWLSIGTLYSTSQGSFTPWTMELSQGPAKYVTGCWTHHGTISVYIKENLIE